MVPLVLNMFNVFTSCVRKLKQCTNLILHGENYTSYVVSVLIYKMGGGEEALFFKFWPIGGMLIRRGGEGGLFEGVC